MRQVFLFFAKETKKPYLSVFKEIKTDCQDMNKSEKRLIIALGVLSGKKKYAQINVQEIAQEAGVHRATFYRHFEDKDDLLERGTLLLLDEIIESVNRDRAEEIDKDPVGNTPPPFIADFLSFLSDNREQFQGFFSEYGPVFFQRALRERITGFFLEERDRYLPPDSPKKEVTASLLASMLLSMLEAVLKGEDSQVWQEVYFGLVGSLR